MEILYSQFSIDFDLLVLFLFNYHFFAQIMFQWISIKRAALEINQWNGLTRNQLGHSNVILRDLEI